MSTRKKILSLCALALSLVIVVGGVFAFFSDKVTIGQKDLTAGTLFVEAEDAVFYNTSKADLTKTATGESDDLGIWNPGDDLIYKVNIANAGEKAAYVRYKVVVVWNDPGADMGALDDATMLLRNSYTSGKVSGSVLGFTANAWNGTAYGTALPFTVVAGETQADPTAADFVIVYESAWSTPVALHGLDETPPSPAVAGPLALNIQFSMASTIGNFCQGMPFSVRVEAEAMQYANNGSPVWTAVEVAPVHLT